jgi:hypothetical protein
MIGIGIGIPFGRRGGVSKEAKDWEANIIANGGTIPAATLKIFDNKFFKPAKSNGNILTELDRLNIYCGLNGYGIAARTNLIKSSHFVSPVNSPTFNNAGYTGGGTSYLNLNYNPATQGVKLTQNSALFGVCFDYNSSNNALMGALSLAPDVNQQLRVNSSTILRTLNNSNDNNNLSVPAIGNKQFIASKRGNSANFDTLGNTLVNNLSSTSSGVPNSNIFEFAFNFGGAPQSLSANTHKASFHGSSNLDYANLRLILLDLFTALGV